MDRRQRKTREAVFTASSALLSQKRFSKITVEEIIDRADVGRSTFYAHFETKDYLLKALCEELFCHIFDATQEHIPSHRHIFSCDPPDSVFLHLFQHFSRNDNHILDLLSGENNDLFLQFFKSGLVAFLDSQFDTLGIRQIPELPKSYLVNHVAATFVETLRWWIAHQMQESPEKITTYFLLAIHSQAMPPAVK